MARGLRPGPEDEPGTEAPSPGSHQTPTTSLSPSEAASQQTHTADGSKPWLPLTLALSGLVGSLAVTLYVGWIAWGYRTQYRLLLERMLDAGAEPPGAPTTHDTAAPIDEA